MINKFEYAPGKPGLGTKGKDGSAGLPGLSMYFTDYNPVVDINSIKNSIRYDLVLWKGSSEHLADGRVYNTGDIFMDSTGKVYEIDAENNTFVYKYANLYSGYFTSADVSTTTYGFNRYYNINSTPKYLIDNVYSNGEIIYYSTPSNIYEIYPQDFTRIEYSNIAIGLYNPFTLYSSAESAGIDDEKAIALVRDISTNTFRLGNLDSVGSIRNVNLTFDVMNLIHTKIANVNEFTPTQPAGSILTNHEIQANSLFDGVFDPSPASFTLLFGENDASISWNLNDFTNDPLINADLYFCKNVSTSNTTYSLTTDASNLRPVIIHNCSNIGSITFSGLESNTGYNYYMKFYKNGWERRSNINFFKTGVTPLIYVSPITLGAEVSLGHIMKFCVSSNVAWNVTSYPINPGGNMLSDASSNYNIGTDTSLWITVSDNSSNNGRTGVFRISPVGSGSPKDVSIYQLGNRINLTVDSSYISQVCSNKDTTVNWVPYSLYTAAVKLTGLVSSSVYTLTMSANSLIQNNNTPEEGYYGSGNYEVIVYKNGSYATSWSGGDTLPPQGISSDSTSSIIVSGINSTDVITYTVYVSSTAKKAAGYNYMETSITTDITSINITEGPVASITYAASTEVYNDAICS